MKTNATPVTKRYLEVSQKVRKVMNLNASFKFRLAALAAIDNGIFESNSLSKTN